MGARLEDLGHRVLDGLGGTTLLEPGVAYREQRLPVGAAAACNWRTQVGATMHRQRVLPDGCVELVFSRGRAPLIYGPRTGWLDIDLDPGGTYQGIRLWPGTARAVLGVDFTRSPSGCSTWPTSLAGT